MKVLITKQSNLCGSEYLSEDEVIAKLSISDRNLYIELDNVMYEIPLAMVSALVLSKEK